MHCFSFSKRASAQKYARPRWLLKNFSPAFMESFHCVFRHKLFLLSPQSRRAAQHICGGSREKSSSLQSFIIPNCPVLTVDISGLFLKNKMQGILTGLIKLYTLKSSRKISTLIFGQVNSILSKTDFRLTYGKSQRERAKIFALAFLYHFIRRVSARGKSAPTLAPYFPRNPRGAAGNTRGAAALGAKSLESKLLY